MDSLRPPRGWAALPFDLLQEVLVPLVRSGDAASIRAVRLACRAWNEALCLGLVHLQPRALDRHIARVFPGLRSVDLSLCPPLQAGQTTALRTLPHLTSLRAVHIVPAQVLGVAAEIAQLSSLTSIDFTGSKCLTDEAVEALARQSTLQCCNVSDCGQLTDAAVFSVAKHLPALQEFHFATHSHGGYASSRVSGKIAGPIASLTALKALDLRAHDNLNAASLGMLWALTGLTSLRLANCYGLMDEALAGITALVNVKFLELTYSHAQPAWMEVFTAGVLRHIARLTALEKLALQGVNWDRVPEGLQAPLPLPQLTELDFSHLGRRLGKLDAAALRLFPLARLQRLDLRRNRADHALLQLPMPELRHLDLSGCSSMTAQVLDHLSGMSKLESLHLDDCEGVKRGNWSFLGRLQGLTSLSWGNRWGGPSWFASEVELEDLPRASGLVREATALQGLRRLRIARQGLEPVHQTMQLLGMMTQLTWLDLMGTFCEDEDMFNDALAHLQPLARLAVLNLASTCVCGRGLASLSTLQGLTELDLSKTALPDGAVRNLKPFWQLVSLHLDDQRLGDAVTDVGLHKIAHIASLRTLSLRGNSSVTATGLEALRSIPSLRRLDVRGCMNVCTHAALRSLQACTSLGEVQMGDWDGVRQPAISARLPLVLESDLGLLQRRLPFLHSVEFGGQVAASQTQYVVSCMHASIRRLVILSLKAFLRIERLYASTVGLPARGAAANLMTSLGLQPSQRPVYSYSHPGQSPNANLNKILP